jgi:hypothetical protein
LVEIIKERRNLMRSSKANQINCICDCGYETGFLNPLKIINKIIKDGGKVDGNTENNILNIFGSICPDCKSKNSFDIESKTIFIKDRCSSLSVIHRM